jgi:hypothetical protein
VLFSESGSGSNISFSFKVDRLTEAARSKWVRSEQLTESGRGEPPEQLPASGTEMFEQLQSSCRGECKQLPSLHTGTFEQLPTTFQDSLEQRSSLSDGKSEHLVESSLEAPKRCSDQSKIPTYQLAGLDHDRTDFLSGSGQILAEQRPARTDQSQTHPLVIGGVEQRAHSRRDGAEEDGSCSGPFDYELFAAKAPQLFRFVDPA